MMSISATCDYDLIARARSRGGVELGWFPSAQRASDFASSGWVDNASVADMLEPVTGTAASANRLIFGLVGVTASHLVSHPGRGRRAVGFGDYYPVAAVAMTLTWLARLGALRTVGAIPGALAAHIARLGKRGKRILTQNELNALWATKEDCGPFFIRWPAYQPGKIEPRVIELRDGRVLVCWSGYDGGYFEAIAYHSFRDLYGTCRAGCLPIGRAALKRLVDHARPFSACRLSGAPKLRVV